MAKTRDEMICSGVKYESDDHILSAKRSVDDIIHQLRLAGGSFEDNSKTLLKNKNPAIETLNQLFELLSNQLKDHDFLHHPHYDCLFNLCFGEGTRFNDWLDEQKVGITKPIRKQIDTIKQAIIPQDIQASSVLQSITVSDEERPISEILNQIVSDYVNLTHSIATTTLFLQRMLNSSNIVSKYKSEIEKFLADLDALKNKLIFLNIEETLKRENNISDVIAALKTFYKDVNYQSTMQFLWDLQEQTTTRFKPLVKEILSNSIKFKFHLGTESPNEFMEYLDTALDKVIKHPLQFKDSDTLGPLNSTHEQYERVHQGQLFVKQFIWDATKDAKPSDVQKITKQTCFSLLFDMDAEINKDSKIIKNDPDFKAGYIEQLLIYLDPTLFSRDINKAFRSQCVPIFLGKETKFGATNHEQFSGADLSGSNSAFIMDVLAAISPVKTQDAYTSEFTVNQKLNAYLNLMRAIDNGSLSFSDAPPLEQKRMIAKRVMHYMVEHNLPKEGRTLEEIEARIQSPVTDRFIKKTSKFFGSVSGEPSIQKLFREYQPKGSAIIKLDK